MAYTPPLFDQGLGRAKKGLDFNRENYVLGTISTETPIFSVASVAASQANTTVAAYCILPGRVKIPKIVVFFSACTSQTIASGSFNIVLGTGAYTQGSIPGNDNSSVPPVGYNAQGQPTGGTAFYPSGGGGIASNPAVAGNAMFAADVAFTVANFPNITTATGTGATYAQAFVPSSPDAVWPNTGVLTLRFTTPSGGTLTNFLVAAYMEPQPLSATFPSAQQPPAYIPEPQIDF